MFSSHGGPSSILCIISVLVYALPKQIHHHYFIITTMHMYRKSQANPQVKLHPQITILVIFVKHKIITAWPGWLSG